MKVPVERDNWKTSSRTSGGKDCVEVSLGQPVGVRDTKDRAGGEMWLSPTAFAALINIAVSEQ